MTLFADLSALSNFSEFGALWGGIPLTPSSFKLAWFIGLLGVVSSCTENPHCPLCTEPFTAPPSRQKSLYRNVSGLNPPSVGPSGWFSRKLPGTDFPKKKGVFLHSSLGFPSCASQVVFRRMGGMVGATMTLLAASSYRSLASGLVPSSCVA